MNVRPLASAALIASSLFFACSDPAPSAGEEEPAEDVSEVNEEKKDKVLDAFQRDGSVFDSAPPESSGEGTLLFLPSIAHSGFDGAHTFKVPISLHGSGSDLVLTADDPSAAAIRPTELADATGDKGVYFMIEPKKAGTIKLTAKSRGQTATATIDVASYAAGRWEAGAQRYANGASAAPACIDCHGGGKGIDHSPVAIASITDGEVARIVTAGERPGHVAIGDVSCASCSAEGKKHIWTVTNEERQGLITYLRGLDPRGFR